MGDAGPACNGPQTDLGLRRLFDEFGRRRQQRSANIDRPLSFTSVVSQHRYPNLTLSSTQITPT